MYKKVIQRGTLSNITTKPGTYGSVVNSKSEQS